MKYWIAAEGQGGEVYSLDKLVVVFHLHGETRERNGGQLLLDWISCQLFLPVDHWTSFKIGTYRDQFSVKCSDGESYFVGVGLNGGSLPDNTARLEFNPNKVGSSWELATVYNRAWELARGRVEIRQYDLAIDYPLRREDVALLKDRRLYEERRRSDADRTQYLGERNKPGRVKLYNKQLEQGLKSPLTRLEMTVGFEDSAPERVAAQMPEVVTVAGAAQTDMELPRLTDTDLFILTTLSREPERVVELGRRKRDTLRPWLKLVNAPLEFDKAAYGMVWEGLLRWLHPIGKHEDLPIWRSAAGVLDGAFGVHEVDKDGFDNT